MPGSSPTMARRSPMRRLNRVDFPTFGRPTIATRFVLGADFIRQAKPTSASLECGALAPLCYWFVFKDQSGGKPPHSKEAHNPNSTITLQAVLMVGYNLRALKSRSTRRDINMKRFL